MRPSASRRRKLRLTITIAAVAVGVFGPIVASGAPPADEPPAATAPHEPEAAPPTDPEPQPTAPAESSPEDTTPEESTPVESTTPTSDTSLETEGPVDSTNPDETGAPDTSSSPSDTEPPGGSTVPEDSSAPDPSPPPVETTTPDSEPPVECPSASFAAGAGSTDGTGGGIVATGDGRTPAAIPLAGDEAAAQVVETSPPSVGGGDIAFPVLGPVQYGNDWGAPRGGVPGDDEHRCHEGTDMFGAIGQPILAPVSGTVRLGVGNRALSGFALSVTGGGYRYNLAHLSGIAPGIGNGSYVEAGQIVGYMGNTGNAGIPHLHFEIRDGNGHAIPSFAALSEAAERQSGQIGIGPWSAIVTGDAESHRVVSTTTGHGRWIIDDAGRVTATGDAALIAPTGQAGPDIAYGTDAAG